MAYAAWSSFRDQFTLAGGVLRDQECRGDICLFVAHSYAAGDMLAKEGSFHSQVAVGI